MFETGLSVIMLIVGLFLLGGGTYASVASIIHSYNVGAVKAPFQVHPRAVRLGENSGPDQRRLSSLHSARTPASSSRAEREPKRPKYRARRSLDDTSAPLQPSLPPFML
jgi:hypothetical protein